MRYRGALLAVVLLGPLSAVAVPGDVAFARADAPTLRSVSLTEPNPVTTPGRCTQIALTGRVDTAGTELTSVSTTVRSEDGAAKTTLGLRLKESRTTTAVSDRVRLCGLDARYASDYVGRYTWTLTVRHPGGVVSVARSFRLRYQGLVHLNATPEPVRRGGWVTLTAWVSDGWEYIDTHPIALSFKPDGSSRWVRQGTMTPRCVSLCSDGDAASWEATTKRRQARSGVWKVVSVQTTYLASGTRSDRVTVRG